MKRCRLVVVFVTGLLVLLVPALVLGQPCPPVELNVTQEPAVQQWWMVLLDALLQLVTPIAIAVLTTLSSIAIRKWGKKLDGDKQEGLIRLTNDFITAGITFAEEQGHKAFKNGERQTASAEKLQHALDFVQERLDRSGLARIGEEELVKLIESRLQHERSKPDGAIPSENGVAAPTEG